MLPACYRDFEDDMRPFELDDGFRILDPAIDRVAGPLVDEFARRYEGATDDDLLARTDSFRFDGCLAREPLVHLLHHPTAPAAPVSPR